jgi:hypothetical protein
MDDQPLPQLQPNQGIMENALRQLFEGQQQQAGLLATLSARLEAMGPPAPPPPPPPPAEFEPAPQGRPPKAVLPNPPRFTGKRVEYRAWRIEVEAKIKIDGAALGTLSNQFYYLYGRMEPSAQLLISAHFSQMSNDPLQATPAAFIKYLDSIFLDPNAAKRAVDKLRTEKQKPTQSFSAFLPQFERLISEGDLSDAPDQVLINYLEGSITDELRRGMVYRGEETTYSAYVHSLLGLSSKLESLVFQNRGAQGRLVTSASAPSWTPARAPARAPDPMDWEPTRASRGKLTPAERQERFDKGLCLYCGSQGHRRADCPSAPPPTRAYGADPSERAPRPSLQRAPAQRAPAPRARVQRAQPQRAPPREEHAQHPEEEVFYDAEEDSGNE